jgi:predicted permease
MPRWYRWALRLYPATYRRQFGEAMAEMFADEWAGARRSGPGATVRLLARTLLDLIVNVPRAYLPHDGLQATSSASPPIMQNVRRDLRIALRSLGKHRGFAAVAALTLALGIGANTAIFSVIRGVLLEPLPYHDAERLVVVWSSYPDNPTFSVSQAEYLDYRAETETMSQTGAYGLDWVTISGVGMAERRRAVLATRSLFEVLGVPAAIGRTFTEEEDTSPGHQVVILSHGIWTSHFGADPGVVGSGTVTIDGSDFTIIGVMPRGFSPPRVETDFYLPAPMDRSTITNRSGHNFNAFGRLAPDATIESARAELATILPRWAEQYDGLHPNDPVVHPLVLVSLHDEILGSVRPMMWALLGTVGLVLLLATANVANLLLARGESRGHEMSIRGALGARRRDVVQQMLTESVVLAVAGGALGIAVAAALVAAVRWLDPGGIPRLDTVGLDWSVLAFTAAITLATGVLFGLFPAHQATGHNARTTLGEGARGGVGRHSKRTLHGLVVLQMTLAVVLLIGSGILIRSFLKLQGVDPGFATENRVAFRVQVLFDRYPEREDKLAFYRRLDEQIQAIPGVSGLAYARALPLRARIGTEGILVEGRELGPDERNPSVDFQIASAGYFELMGIPVLRGRSIAPQDLADAPPVILINDAAARAYFAGEDPVGQRVRLMFTPRDYPNVTIAGVVGDVHHRDLAAAPRPEIYMPLAQVPGGWISSIIGSMSVVVRTDLPLDAVGPAIRRTVQDLDPTVPVDYLASLEQAVGDDIARDRFVTLLLALFAGVALIIAAVGVYGVMAFSVARRTREIGIRMALGAEPRAILGSIVRTALAISAVGAVFGVVSAGLATSVLESLVYDISVRDVTVFALSPLVLLLVAAAAAMVPAWRAAAVHPMETLRAE